jgi:hypothetical protein
MTPIGAAEAKIISASSNASALRTPVNPSINAIPISFPCGFCGLCDEVRDALPLNNEATPYPFRTPLQAWLETTFQYRCYAGYDNAVSPPVRRETKAPAGSFTEATAVALDAPLFLAGRRASRLSPHDEACIRTRYTDG